MKTEGKPSWPTRFIILYLHFLNNFIQLTILLAKGEVCLKLDYFDYCLYALKDQHYVKQRILDCEKLR